MKSPELNNCPCCGAIVSVVGRANADNVAAECEQAHDREGVLMAFVLFWRCRVCGCRWKHGQFGGDEVKHTNEETK